MDDLEKGGSAGPGETSASPPRSLGNRILQFGPTRIVLAVLGHPGCDGPGPAGRRGGAGRLGLGPLRTDSPQYVIPLVIAVHFAYLGYVRLVERRRASELSGKGAVRETGAGIAVGAGLLAVTVTIIAVLGYYESPGRTP